MTSTTTLDPGTILKLIDPETAYITRDLQRHLAIRTKVARLLAGRISQDELANAVNDQTGAGWSRNVVASIELDNPRKRVTVTDLENLARTFRDRYGLAQVDVDWLVGDAAGSFPTDSPGYLGSLDDLLSVIIDVTDEGPATAA